MKEILYAIAFLAMSMLLYGVKFDAALVGASLFYILVVIMDLGDK